MSELLPRCEEEPITAVIPNRDGAPLLRRTLSALLQELPPERHEILVVDDASQDDSRALLRAEFPAVRVIPLAESVGFGQACLRGFREARHPLVLLLNSDMEVTPGSVALLRQHFQDPALFAVGPLYWSDDPARPRPTPDPRGYRCQLGSPAGGGLFRRDRFLQLGGFDPLYHPFYWEDLDLGWAAWREGWRILEDGRCHFIHRESATIRKLYPPAYVARVRLRNRCLFGWKNLRSPLLLARFQAISLARALTHLLRRRDPSLLLGIADSLQRLPAVWQSRRGGGARDTAAILRDSETHLRSLLTL